MEYGIERGESGVYHGIAIAGANGSGKTTLGRCLAGMLGCKHMDAEDYFFRESEVPYAKARPREEALVLLAADIREYGRFIISAVNCDFGEEINAMYDCVVYIEAPLEIRIDRIKKRSLEKFGNRVFEGGDMYEREQKFYEFAAARTMEHTKEWLDGLKCPVIYIDGTEPLEDNAGMIKEKAALFGIW